MLIKCRQVRQEITITAAAKRVGEVLQNMASEGIGMPSTIAATRLLILTGCRLNEITTLQQEHVDLPGKALRLSDCKTGAKVVQLGQSAIDVLEKIGRVERNPLRDCRHPPRRPADRPSALLAASQFARRPEECPDPRSPTHLLLYHSRRRPGAAGDRQAKRRHPQVVPPPRPTRWRLRKTAHLSRPVA